MDTLVSVGVLAAFGWSLVALFHGTAGVIGMTHPFGSPSSGPTALDNIYLEAAAGVTTFLLAGRWFEKRSKRRAGAALRALMELGAKDVTVLRDGAETRVPVAELRVGRPVRGPAGGEGRHRRSRRERYVGGRRRRC